MVYGFLTVALVLVGARLGAGSAGYGVLLGGFGAGGVGGALLAGRIEARVGWRRALAGALVLVALPMAALGLVPAFAAAIALALVAGSGMIVGEVLWETALPRMVGDDVLARAYGLVIPVAIGGIAAGSLVAGPLISLLGLGGALAAVGAFVLVAGALLTAPAPRRRLAPLPA